MSKNLLDYDYEADISNRSKPLPRLLAALTDVLFIGILAGAISLVPGLALEGTDSTGMISALTDKLSQAGLRSLGVSSVFLKGFFPAWLLVAALYYLSEVIFAASPGKMFFGLCIRGFEGHRTASGNLMMRAMIKNIMPFGFLFALIARWTLLIQISGVFWIVVVIGYILVIKSDRLTLHDQFSKTAVYPKNRAKS